MLEQVSLGKLSHVDHIEALACAGGCIGGPLTVENRFVAQHRMQQRIRKMIAENAVQGKPPPLGDLDAMLGMVERQAIEPRPILWLDENVFKAMCYSEYSGFFYIGMMTRNERNAIIQHGTMTMVRKDLLNNTGKWSEWTICEDAELGLRSHVAGVPEIDLDAVIDRKLKYAEKLMREHPEYSIEETATHAGFNDPFYFSRIYRKYRKIAPSEYRRVMKAGPQDRK